CADEVKTKEDLAVDLPAGNADFHTLALALGKTLPRSAEMPTTKEAALAWQKTQRVKLREVVRAKDYTVKAEKVRSEEKGGVKATVWKLKLSEGPTADVWTVPVVELMQGEPKGTTILLADGGRRNATAAAERLLAAGQRVLAVDPFYFGEAKIEQKD